MNTLELTLARLKFLQDNLTMLQDSRAVYIPNDLGGYKLKCGYGICYNALNGLHYDIRERMFSTWAGFSGSTCFPVDGQDEYYARNLYLNPKRIALLAHCISYIENLIGEQND